jgi:2-polyprenyl-6-hydroxyphenyl methylase/3-demethylubiquinone-9 3-methyltransferase
MTRVHERFVADRFSSLESRFKASVAGDDVRLAALRRALGPLAGLSILDLGCGKGRFARQLALAGARIVGVDIALGMLGHAGGIDRVRASASRLPLRSRSFDAVVAVEVLQHVAPAALPEVITEAARVLRPAGRLLVIDRNATALDARRPWLPRVALKCLDEHRGRWMYRPGEPVRERWFRKSQLSRLLAFQFEHVACTPIVHPDETHHPIFRLWPARCTLLLWSAANPRTCR